MPPITVIHDAWRVDPLAWIHRSEARSIAKELRSAGLNPTLIGYSAHSLEHHSGKLLLRLSDPVMWDAVHALTHAGVAYVGPSADVMAHCYDKYEAYRILSAKGIDCPATKLGSEARVFEPPFIIKPRRGSDSIGLKLIESGDVPRSKCSDRHLVQEYVRGSELTIGVIREHVGMPLQILLPEGTLYSFARKYLLTTRKTPVTDGALAARVRAMVRRIAALLEINWAARIDLIHETRTDRLVFLECDVAPLIGAYSAFAASLAAAGITREQQLRALLNEEI